jgi:hypothetical protein
VLGGVGHLEQTGLRHQRAIPANPVNRAVARGRHQPRTGIGGRSLARPPLGRDRKRLLRGLLGDVEVAEEADQRSEDASPLVAKDLLEDQ